MLQNTSTKTLLVFRDIVNEQQYALWGTMSGNLTLGRKRCSWFRQRGPLCGSLNGSYALQLKENIFRAVCSSPCGGEDVVRMTTYCPRQFWLLRWKKKRRKVCLKLA